MSKALEAIHSPPVGSKPGSSFKLAFRTRVRPRQSSLQEHVSDLNLLSPFWFCVLAQIQDVQVVQSLGEGGYVMLTPCIPSRWRTIRHFVLTNNVQTKHTAHRWKPKFLPGAGVQRVQICLNGRSCAAVDAGISPCHDVTIQNPQNALVNIKSVVLQLRQPGGALLVSAQ